mgnify:CR=1 FL=1
MMRSRTYQYWRRKSPVSYKTYPVLDFAASDDIKDDFTRAEKLLAICSPVMQFSIYIIMILVAVLGGIITVKSLGGIDGTVEYLRYAVAACDGHRYDYEHYGEHHETLQYHESIRYQVHQFARCYRKIRSSAAQLQKICVGAIPTPHWKR